MALERLSFYKSVAQLAGVRIGNYLELALLEVAIYKAALIRTLVAYMVMAFCAVFALAFLSVAVLVTYWATDARIAAAWWIFGTWCALAIVAFLVARSGTPDDAPTSTISEQIKLDLSAIRGDHE